MVSHAPTGELSILNCRAGDIRITFDKDSEVEVERAKRMIQDMLKRGYVLAVEIKGKLVLAKEFDAARGEYIVADGGTFAAEPVPTVAEPFPVVKGKRGQPKGRVPMKSAKATAIPPMGGG